MDIPVAAPARLGRYELLARLATGGMGEIFLARLEGAAGFEKLFVVKRILPHLAGDPRFRGMLIAEAQIASMMAHANICQVYELGETDGQLYIVMEYLEGTTMLPLLRKLSKEAAPLDLGFVGGVLQQATDGLHYAHELKDRAGEYLGIVHRDVSPSNVFLTYAGVVKVLDFGIAKVKNVSAQTQTGAVKGKYAYMAPEQLRGTAVDRRADVFALGVMVYEMLALRRLFQRKTDYLTFRAVMEQPIIDIRHYRADCPDALATTVTRALDRDPANRFDTARQFGSAVLDSISGLRRPWTQGEISDFIARHFADEIKQRSAQIAGAVRSSGPRQTMPLIAQVSEDTGELEDGAQEFAPVASESSETPVDVRHLRGPSSEQPAQREPTPTVPQLNALRGVPGPGEQPPSVVVVNPRRSVIWPLVAFAMLAVAGGALFLVWRQMENQPPTIVFSSDGDSQITKTGSDVVSVERRKAPAAPAQPAVDESAPAADPEPPGSGAAPPRPPRIARPREAPARSQSLSDVNRTAVLKKQDEVNRCTVDHGNPPPGTTVVVAVAPSGRPTSVTIEPASVDSTALGACIKGAFKTGTFQRADADYEFEVRLTLPRRRARLGPL